MSEQQFIERYWRDATPADAIKEPPMVARFRNGEVSPWLPSKLNHWARNRYPWVMSNGYKYRYCQVYDAPDPGEGWRLIDTANEKWQEGDEIYEQSTGTWRKRLTPFQDWALSVNRRRIEPPKPEPRYEPFRWEDREQLRGRWITREKDGYVIEEIAYRFDSRAFEVVAKNLLQDCWRFLDTGEPVGKKVQ